MPPSTCTAAVEVASPPEEVVAILRDPRRLPEWAPAFADRIDPAGEDWQATKDGRSFGLRLRASADAGTVDYLRDLGDGRTGGAYLRAIPNPAGGTTVTFTLPVPPGTAPADVARTAEEELARLRALLA